MNEYIVVYVYILMYNSKIILNEYAFYVVCFMYEHVTGINVNNIYGKINEKKKKKKS